MRDLLAFALVASEYERTGDAVAGLSPLFAPLIAERPDVLFEPAWLSKRFSETYGLTLPVIAAQGLADRFVLSGLLVETTDGKGNVIFRHANLPVTQQSINESEIQSVLDGFRAWAIEKLRNSERDISQGKLEDGFLERVKRPEFSSLFVLQDRAAQAGRVLKLRTAKSKNAEWSVGSVIDFLFADFLFDLSKNNIAQFDKIAKISFGVLVAEALGAIKEPAADAEKLKNLTAIIDGPILLDLLDINSKEQHEYALEFIGLLAVSGIRVSTYDHVVHEMKRLISATLDAHFGESYAYGSLAQRLRIDRGHAAFARFVLNNLEGELAKFNIEVLSSADQYWGASINWFPEKDIDRLRNRIGEIHHQLDRRENDVRTVACVLRTRKANRMPASLPDAETIFVTRNAALADQVGAYLESSQVTTQAKLVCITDGRLVAALWFSQAKDGLELNSKRIIANCANAISPRFDVVTKMASILEHGDPERLEQFSALMRDSRASICLMRATLGSPALLDENRVDEVLGKMTVAAAEDLVQPIKEWADAEVKKKADEVEKLLDETEKQQQLLSGLESRLREADSDVKSWQEKNGLQRTEAEIEQQNLNNQIVDLKYQRTVAREGLEQELNAIKTSERKLSKRIVWYFLIVYIFGLLITIFIDNPGLIAKIVAAVGSIITISTISAYVRSIPKKISRFCYSKELTRMESLLDKLPV